MEGVADAEKSLQADGHRHEDGAAQADVGERVEEVREGDGVDIQPYLKCPDIVVDPPTDDVEGVKKCKSDQELVETVPKLWSKQHKDGDDIADDSDESNEKDKNSVTIISKTLHDCRTPEWSFCARTVRLPVRISVQTQVGGVQVIVGSVQAQVRGVQFRVGSVQAREGGVQIRTGGIQS